MTNKAETSARSLCRQAIKESVPPAVWEQNGRFVREIEKLIAEHPIMRHPLIEMLGSAELPLEAIKRSHLEFRYTFAKIFTDSLILAMYEARAVEPAYGPIAKVSARFLLQYNLLDELGFAPAGSDGEGYGGSPHDAHFIQFDETLAQLGCDWRAADRYTPTDEAVAVRQKIESSYGDYALLMSALAVAETVFDKFAGPWAANVARKTSVDVAGGYHAIHVEHEGHSMDDVHSEDLWYVFRQGVTEDRYADIRRNTSEYLDILLAFVNRLAEG